MRIANLQSGGVRVCTGVWVAPAGIVWYQTPMNTLDETAIRAALADLEGWRHDGDAIVRELRFGSFLDAIAFINRLAPLAEAANHHPELCNVYSRVVVTLSTHDAGGVTEKDLALAREIEAIL